MNCIRIGEKMEVSLVQISASFFDILGLCRPYAMKDHRIENSNNISMFKNYFKITYRNLLRQKVYSFLNLSGLAIGLACSILIFLYVQDELSYDRFHEKSDRTYRLLEHFQDEGNGEHSASQPFPAGPTFQSEYPDEVAYAVRLFNFQSPSLALANKESDKAFNESRVFFADSTFLDVFDFNLISGSRETALDNPNSILITASMARKYFPDEDPLGKFLELQGIHNLKVVGVLEDSPKNAHFQFDFIISFSSLKTMVWWSISKKLVLESVLDVCCSRKKMSPKIKSSRVFQNSLISIFLVLSKNTSHLNFNHSQIYICTQISIMRLKRTAILIVFTFSVLSHFLCC